MLEKIVLFQQLKARVSGKSLSADKPLKLPHDGARPHVVVRCIFLEGVEPIERTDDVAVVRVPDDSDALAIDELHKTLVG